MSNDNYNRKKKSVIGRKSMNDLRDQNMACAHIWITKKCRKSSVFSCHNLISWLLRKWRSYGLTFFCTNYLNSHYHAVLHQPFFKDQPQCHLHTSEKIEYCPMHRPCLQFHRRAAIHKCQASVAYGSRAESY